MMRWPWHRTDRTDSPADGAHAHGAAQEALDQAKAQRPAVNEVAETLRQLRQGDHFVENVARAMRRRT